jgi:hypothetical protein
VDPFHLRDLGETIGEEAGGPASPVTPEGPSRPQIPETPGPVQTDKRVTFDMAAQHGTSTGGLPPLTITNDQLQQLLQQLQPHPTPSSNPKVEDPELYYGKRPKLQAFITQCELKFNCEANTFDNEVKRVNYASSRCRGNAWACIEPSINQGKSTYTTWEEFKTAITRAFGEADSKEVARRKFKAARQGTQSAAAYWADFQRIVADLDYNDAMYIDQFNDGLHIDVQRQLALLDTRPTTMIEFANKAIALDNRLFNFRILRTRNEPQYYREYGNTHPRPLQHQQELALPDPEPMELDATRRFRFRNRTEEEKRRKNNQCYNCGKVGHYAA